MTIQQHALNLANADRHVKRLAKLLQKAAHAQDEDPEALADQMFPVYLAQATVLAQHPALFKQVKEAMFHVGG